MPRKLSSGPEFERVFQEELALVRRRTEEQYRRDEADRLRHLRRCQDADCPRCRIMERLLPEMVARVRAEKRLRLSARPRGRAIAPGRGAP